MRVAWPRARGGPHRPMVFAAIRNILRGQQAARCTDQWPSGLMPLVTNLRGSSCFMIAAYLFRRAWRQRTVSTQSGGVTSTWASARRGIRPAQPAYGAQPACRQHSGRRNRYTWPTRHAASTRSPHADSTRPPRGRQHDHRAPPNKTGWLSTARLSTARLHVARTRALSWTPRLRAPPHRSAPAAHTVQTVRMIQRVQRAGHSVQSERGVVHSAHTQRTHGTENGAQSPTHRAHSTAAQRKASISPCRA